MKVIVQGLAVEYRDEGEGETLLFLHGWKDNLQTFDRLVPLLPSCRIIRLDLPGFGGSEHPKEAWDLNNYTSFVESFIKKIGIRVDVVVGHSFGGRVVIKGTEKIGVRKIILIAGAGVSERSNLRNYLIKMLAKIGGVITYLPPFVFFREKMRKKLYSSIRSDYLNAGSLKETFLRVVSEDLTEKAKLIQMPTLLIWGSKDQETPLANGILLNNLISKSKLEIIPGAGHFVHKDYPNEVAKLIREFI